MISEDLKLRLLAFRAERDWEQFHNLRTLSASIVLEAAELLEHTQWARDADIPEIVTARRREIEHEVADIAILITYLSSDLGIDLEAAVSAKLAINAEKYPQAKAVGTSRKYSEL
jgi:NTP pyrophosphatase (non-canonical NTP hydrolase)